MNWWQWCIAYFICGTFTVAIFRVAVGGFEGDDEGTIMGAYVGTAIGWPVVVLVWVLWVFAKVWVRLMDVLVLCLTPVAEMAKRMWRAM